MGIRRTSGKELMRWNLACQHGYDRHAFHGTIIRPLSSGTSFFDDDHEWHDWSDVEENRWNRARDAQEVREMYE